MANPTLVQLIVPPDALAFKEALSHVSEGMADETELLADGTNI